MSEETQIRRLDRSKPPPGMWADEAIWNGSGQPPADDEHCSWGFDFEEGTGFYKTLEDALAAAWAHYQERNDPPGMWSYDDGRFGFAVNLDGLGTMLGRTGGRAAAWAWYWRRVAVANVLWDIHFMDHTWSWPRCLAWSDEQVAEVERWVKWHTTRGQKVSKNPVLPAVFRG